jgi:RNA polymerase-interacting CarD/CdnL/TRCF family regulator
MRLTRQEQQELTRLRDTIAERYGNKLPPGELSDFTRLIDDLFVRTASVFRKRQQLEQAGARLPQELLSTCR